jgi:fatty acid desaturase
MSTSAEVRLRPEVLQAVYGLEHGRHYSRLATFIMLYLAGAVGAWWCHLLSRSGILPWLAALPMYVLAAASLHGISLFAHEAVHNTLSANRKWNWILGAACAIPVLQNCSAYRVLHLRHHKHLGEEGDPDHYANYTRWTWMIFCMNWLRLIAGYPIYIVMIPVLGFKHGTPRDRILILCEVFATLALAVIVWLSSVPTALVVHGWLIPMILINTLVNIRGMSQHTLLTETTDEIKGTRTILTRPLVRFFMCNENYHLEHHLYPGVPWYHLSKVHAALRAELAAKGAPYIPSYYSFVRQFVAQSILRSPAGLKRGRQPQ